LKIESGELKMKNSIMNYELFGVGSGLALHDETETMLLSQTITHPQPPLKRGACAIALWGEGINVTIW
jgi:hypothetical protein